MKSNIQLYDLLPIFMQNIAVTLKGYQIKQQRYGGKFQKYTKELNRSQWYSNNKLKEIQLNRLKKIIEHSYKYVPYYRNLFIELGLVPEDITSINDLKKIPITNKTAVKHFHSKFIAQNIPKKKLIQHRTGGTTGTSLTMYVTSDSLRYNFAFLEERCKRWSGVRSGDKLATFLGRQIVPTKQKKPPFWRFNRAYNQILFSSYHMNDKNLKFYIDEYNHFKPKIIQGYVSNIYIFAKFILAHNLTVHSPTSILLSSETLFDWQRKIIEEAFQAKIYNGYSMAEFVAFISECEKGNLHVSTEYGIIEFDKIIGFDDKYEIIATTLFNYAMPLIRYKTGDIVTFSKNNRCSCGRMLPIINSIEGRKDNMLITPEGNYISSASMSLIFKNFDYIEEAQIVQYDKLKITVNIVLIKNIDTNFERLILELKKILGSKMEIVIRTTDKLERTVAGKYQFIISKV